jgi:integrase
MQEKRIVVWVQRFKDRQHLMLQWFDPQTGKRKSKSAETTDADAAEIKRGDLEAMLNAGLHKESSRMGWEAFREAFEAEYLPGVRASTASLFRHTFDLFEELGRPVQLRALNERSLSQFVAAMRSRTMRDKHKGYAASTIRRALQNLHTALAWAVEQKIIPACPKFPTVRVPKRNPQPVPEEHFLKLVEAAPDAYLRAYIMTAWLAGLRLSEAASLLWERSDDLPWVDLAGSRIWLPARFVKANADQWVPLDPALRETLMALPRTGDRVFRFVDRRVKRVEREIATHSLSERIKRLAACAGVPLTYHKLRKGFGCRYAGKVAAHVLQRLMRHASIKTTMDYYVNIDAAVEEAVLGSCKGVERNSSRNSQGNGDCLAGRRADVNPEQDRGNSQLTPEDGRE